MTPAGHEAPPTSARPPEERPRPEVPARCGGCGLGWDAMGWVELALVERITSEQVQEFVTIWPVDAVIEVRRCTCGQAISRRRPRTAPGPTSPVG